MEETTIETSIEKKGRVPILLRVPADVYLALKRTAQRNGLSFNDWASASLLASATEDVSSGADAERSAEHEAEVARLSKIANDEIKLSGRTS